ncbi:MAG: hypothetical protein H7Y00_03340 [Fimbriimonadaceae bacterium]|nr:hypothetical protein [Chitinophagales bacterium]
MSKRYTTFIRKYTMQVKTYTSFFLLSLISVNSIYSQVNTDGFYPGKQNGSIALSFSYENFNTFYLGSGELADFSGNYITTGISAYAVYGITDDLAASLSIPYIHINALEMGEQGLQDLSINAKYKLVKVDAEKINISISPALGFSFPVTNYLLSDFGIGQQATGFDARIIVHMKTNSNFFAEMQGGGLLRFDPAPGGFVFLAKTGYAGNKIYADVSYALQKINEGQDLETPSVNLKALGISYQKINATIAHNIHGFSVYASGGYVLDGENIGKAIRVGGGILYRF